MEFYLFQFLFLFVFAFATSNVKDKNLYFLFKSISFLLLFIPAAIRYGIGTDYFSYMEIFFRLNKGRVGHTEIGWNYLNIFLGKLGFSFISVFVVSSFIFYIFLMFTNKKDFFVVIITYYCYLYLPCYNIIRSGIVSSMAWYAYLCLKNDKKLKSFLILLLAISFHLTAVLFIPLFLFMEYVKISKRQTLIFAFFIYVLFEVFSFRKMFFMIPWPDDFKYTHYLATSFFDDTPHSTGYGIILRRVYMIIAYLMANNYKSNKERNYVNWWFLAILFFDILGTQIFAFQRLTVLFYIAYMAIVSHINLKTRNGYLVLGNVFVFSYIIVFVFVLSIISEKNFGVFPYTTIWSAYNSFL